MSIICPNVELADALATSVFVLGKDKGLDLINRLKGIECLLITDKQELFTSDNLHLDYIQKPITNHKYQIKIGNEHAQKK